MVLLSFVDSTSASAAAEIVMVGVLGAGEGITSVCVELGVILHKNKVTAEGLVKYVYVTLLP